MEIEWNMICRVCLLQEGEMTSIYEKDETNKTIQEKIMICSPIRFQNNSTFPKQICSKCLSDLTTAYRFYSNCENTEAVLKSITENLISNSDSCDYDLKDETEIQSENSSNIKQEIVDSYNEEDDREQIEFLHSSNYDEDEYPKDYYNVIVYDENQEIESVDMQSDEIEEQNNDECVENYEEDIESEPSPEIETKKRKKSNKTDDSDFETPKTLSTTIENGIKTTIVRVKLPKPLKICEKSSSKPLKICEICGNTYKYRHALENHMRRHRGEKPFQCSLCDKAFVISFELKRHMRTHTGQKPYQCKYCDRRYSDFGSRIKHERSHTGERPYSCSQCGKTFAYSHVLSSHMLIHTGEKKYQCTECGKKFTKSHHLKAHKNTHLRAMQRLYNKSQTAKVNNKLQTETLINSSQSSEQTTTTIVLQPGSHIAGNLADFAKDNNLLNLDVITIFDNIKQEPKNDDEINQIIVEHHDAVIEDMMAGEE